MSSSDFKSKYIEGIVCPRRRHARDFLRSITFHNLHDIDSLHDNLKIDAP